MDPPVGNPFGLAAATALKAKQEEELTLKEERRLRLGRYQGLL